MTGINYHTHTLYSDGKNQPYEYVEEAIRLGMTAIGFSDHSPLLFDNPFSIKNNELGNYANEIRELQKYYSDKIEIFLSLEMDFIPGMSENFQQLKERVGLDYVIGSVHLVGKDKQDNLWFTDGPDPAIYDQGLFDFYDNDIRKAVGAFYNQTNEMIESQVFDIIGHFDKIKMHNQNRYFLETEKWYQNNVFETLHLMKQKGLIVEINTRGIYKKRSDSLYPSGWILHEMKKMHIPVIISSDAHQPSEIQAEFKRAVETLQAAGYHEIMWFQQGKWIEKPIL
ncbi:MAG: hypothetical protein CVT92_10450 [Bacteroidetes bacterium HGW-Bacteroidetes-1]|jgi:histidinol-phosphatase (PHP family)|nr:MAG: hypothetical protein CVT92_10450 [Bacteroidetes bacterium HGW-Bacteroidetes-1]